MGCCPGDSDQEALVERAEIEAPVQPVAKRGKVTYCVLSKVERMVAARQTGFEITEDGIDPLEFRYICA
jgi:hypothetical protein